MYGPPVVEPENDKHVTSDRIFIKKYFLKRQSNRELGYVGSILHISTRVLAERLQHSLFSQSFKCLIFKIHEVAT